MNFYRIILFFWLIEVINNSQGELQTEIDFSVDPISFKNLSFQPLYNFQSDPTSEYQNITIFQASALSITKLRFDPRHLTSYSENQQNLTFQFGEGWNVTNPHYMIDNLTQENYYSLIYDDGNLISLPEGFQSNETNKFENFAFKLFALQDIRITISMIIKNSLYFSNKFEMLNITKISNSVPNRAQYGQSKIFLCVQTSNDDANLPMNPLLLQQDSSNSPLILDYHSEKKAQPLTPQQQISNVNIFNYATEYWGNRDTILLPYLPYFSNCKNYGHYIFLQELLEGNQCNLIPVDQTKPINPFVFGDKPISDQCSNITIQCVLDEPYDNTQSYWFFLSTGKTLFNIYSVPLSSQEISDQNLDQTQYVPVMLSNQIPNGKMAMDIVLTFNYYQVTKTDKKIISASLEFQNFFQVTNAQINGTNPIQYNLQFNFLPMGQSDLVNAFALDWPVYLVIYLGIGALSVSEIGIFLLYHYIFNREKRPKLKFFPYFKDIQPSQFQGVLLAILPLFVILVLIATIMNGSIWHINLEYACKLDPPSNLDTSCPVVIFDVFKNDLKYSDSGFQNLRYGRTGLTLVICGIYLFVSISKLFLIMESDSNKVQKWSNQNLWKYEKWRTSSFLLLSILVSIALVVMIQFSFSTLFSNQVMYFIVFFKVIFILSEYFLEELLQSSLVVAPFSGIMATTLNIATMGAPNFYQFLFSYFIDICMQMVERAYISKLQEDIFEFCEASVQKIQKLLKKIFSHEDEESDNEEENDGLKKQQNEAKNEINQSFESDDNEILFTVDYHENLISEDDSYIDSNKSISIHNNQDEMESEDEFEVQFREKINDVRQIKLQQEMNVEGEKSSLEKNQMAINVKNEDERERKELLIKLFQSFQLDAVGLLCQPFYIGIMWSYYEGSYWAENYMISYQNFIFYFLWSLIIIPFQISIDVLFYNVVEQFHGLNFLDYIHELKDRFSKRKNSWKRFEHYKGCFSMETSLQSCDQTCYSSQFYFLIALGLTSQFMLMMGLHMIYWNQYVLFSDSGKIIFSIQKALLFIIVFWVAICYVIEKFSIFVAMRLGIWKLPPVQKLILTDSSTHSQIKVTSVLDLPQNSKSIFKIPNWDKVIDNIEKAVQIQVINDHFIQGEYTTDTFRKIFLRDNTVWLKEHFDELFTPRTTMMNRSVIIKSFEKIYGRHIRLIEIMPKEEVFEGRQISKKDIHINGFVLQKKNDVIQHFAIRILQQWYNRMNHLKRAKRLVGGLLEIQTKAQCMNCGLNWGLTCSNDKSYEDLYLDFLKQNKTQQTLTMGEIDSWQSYFLKHSNIQTICFICNGFMVDALMKNNPKKVSYQDILKKLKNRRNFRNNNTIR